MGSAKVAGSPATTRDSALSPPHEVPIITISYTPLPNLPVHLLCARELLVGAFVRRKPKRLLRPETQNPEMHEGLVKEPMHALLQVAGEVDEHVTTENDVELRE